VLASKNYSDFENCADILTRGSRWVCVKRRKNNPTSLKQMLMVYKRIKEISLFENY
jgi:hypothetical protein